VENLDLSGSALEGVGSSFCADCKKLRELLLPPTLKRTGDDFLCGSPSVENLDLSGTALESVGGSFCSHCRKLRELRLPPTLKEIGDYFLCGSPSVENLDLSGTAVECIGDSFCSFCGGLREIWLPGALVFLGSKASPGPQLALLSLPVASRMWLGEVPAASIMSGLVGLGSTPARPMWPAK
jgi:hypothetical protein